MDGSSYPVPTSQALIEEDLVKNIDDLNSSSEDDERSIIDGGSGSSNEFQAEEDNDDNEEKKDLNESKEVKSDEEFNCSSSLSSTYSSTDRE